MRWKFWKKSEKQEDLVQPEDPVKPEATHEEHLLEKRKELQKNLDVYQENAARRLVDTGIYSVIGATALAVDWVALGGIGTLATLLAGGNSVFFTRNTLNTQRLRKQLMDVEEKIQACKKTKESVKDSIQSGDSAVPQPISDEFNLSVIPAQEVSRRLAELKKQADEIEKHNLGNKPLPKSPGL